MKLSVQIPHRRTSADPYSVVPSGDRSHPGFTFGGALDEVPSHDAAALAEVARLLLRHGDHHQGRPARVSVVTDSDSLVLDVDDPECTVGCLARADEFALITAVVNPRSDHLSLDNTEGLHLQWLVPLSFAGRR